MVEISKTERRPGVGSGGATSRRPPGALPGWKFTDRCTRCGDCVEVCPVRVIVADAAGYPALAEPDRCCQCGLCADICSPSALRFTELTGAGIEGLLATERRLVPR